MSVVELIREFQAAGGNLRLVDGEVKATVPTGAAALLPQLREHKAEIFKILCQSQPRPSDMAAAELLASEIRAWDDVLVLWTRARCSWRDRSWGGLTALYIDHVQHAHKTGGMFAPDVETFRALLMALGFQVSDDGFVYGLLLREDAEAARWKPEPPKPTLRKRGAK